MMVGNSTFFFFTKVQIYKAASAPDIQLRDMVCETTEQQGKSIPVAQQLQPGKELPWSWVN